MKAAQAPNPDLLKRIRRTFARRRRGDYSKVKRYSPTLRRLAAAAVSGGHMPGVVAEAAVEAENTVTPIQAVPAVKKAERPSDSHESYSTPSQYPDPKHSSAAELLPGLVEIVNEAGPIVCEHAYRIFIKRAGFQRLGEVVVERFNEAIRLGVRKGMLDEDNDHRVKLIAKRVVRVQGSPKVVVRRGTGRILDEIPPSELAALMVELESGRTFSNDHDLFREVLEVYGLARLTENAETALKAARVLVAPQKGEQESLTFSTAQAEKPLSPDSGPQVFELRKMPPSEQLSVLQKLIRWDESARKMTNNREYIWINGAKKCIYRLERGQPPESDDLRKAADALDRAVFLGFRPVA